MLNTFARPEVSMNYVLVDEGVPLVAGNIVLEIQRRTLEKPEIYLGLETEVRISEQMPAGESTGVDVPGQLWKRYHMEKVSIAANLNTAVEMGMSHGEDTVQNLFTYFAGGQFLGTNVYGKFAIGASLLNFVVFFLTSRNMMHLNPKQIHRRQEFKRDVRRNTGITKHKCAICGRTEVDSPQMQFRFCSKCDGNYEYCEEHLYTHTHIKRQ